MDLLCKKSGCEDMIRIAQFPPPASYAQRVKIPGENFLARNPHPTNKEFNKHSYWRRMHEDLHTLYAGICAYCASWTPRNSSTTNDRSTVDHFIPKSVSPIMAYQWENFRLCRSRINANKGINLKVMDPFHVDNGWFQIDFLTFMVVASPTSSQIVFDRVTDSIRILCLNDNDYVNERVEVIRRYCLDIITFDNLRENWPFIASEILRVNFDMTLKEMMREYFATRP